MIANHLCFVIRFSLVLAWATTVAHAARPNIIFILADDLGYGDIGAFGQSKIQTPNLDRLAAEGMRFTRHYAGSPVCAPSRCVLLTGKHPGHAWIRDNREARPEGQSPLRASETTIAEVLKSAGYTCGAIGKWGLGPPGSEGDPLKQGFDRFFGYNCQRQAHNHYPEYLYDDRRQVRLNNPSFPAHQKLPPEADPADEASYAHYRGKSYAPDLMVEEAERFVRRNRSRPFFLYFASTIPHLALQAPPEALAKYKGKWPETPYTGTNSYLPHLTPRAAYAGMVTRLDEHAGRLMRLIDELRLASDTIFIFTSDNGPLYNRLGGTDCEFFESARNLRGHKGSVYEGGLRVPLIVRWKDHISAASVSGRVTGFEDWLPTLLELCAMTNQLPNVDGISFVPTLLGRHQEPRPFLYREFPAYGGQQSVHAGDWKAVRQKLNAKDGRINTELYHLADDPTESRNVAHENPDVVARLERIMAAQHARSELFPIRLLDHP
jgi:arylsulfatase A